MRESKGRAKKSLPKPRALEVPVVVSVRQFRGQSSLYTLLAESKGVLLGYNGHALQLRAKAGETLPRTALPDGWEIRRKGVYAKRYDVSAEQVDTFAQEACKRLRGLVPVLPVEYVLVDTAR